MVGSGSSGGGEEGFTGRAAIGYDHGYDGEVFYLGLALDERYVEGWVEGCLERIGEDYPEGELLCLLALRNRGGTQPHRHMCWLHRLPYHTHQAPAYEPHADGLGLVGRG